jgi:hypothetical protein
VTHPPLKDPAALQRQELQGILRSRPFARAGKLRQLAAWLGERAITGPHDKPSEYVVGVEALGRPADFDPSYDVSVRQLKRRLCQRLEEYYAVEGRASRYRMVCDRGFAVRFELAAPPPASKPCVAVLPLLGDEAGLVNGSLSHALVETGGLLLIGRTAALEEPLQRLIEHHGAGFLIEGEFHRLLETSWELSLRLLDAPHSFVLSGLRISGTGPISADTLRDAAAQLRTAIQLAPLQSAAAAG